MTFCNDEIFTLQIDVKGSFIMVAGMSQKFLVATPSLKHEQVNYFLIAIATMAQHHMITPVKAHYIVRRGGEEERGGGGTCGVRLLREEGGSE